MNGPERPLGISSVGFGLCEECPVYSRKRRKSRHSLTSPQCQLRPSCTAAKRLFDHFVGERQQLVWKLETECLGGREIDDQPVSRRLLHRQLGGLGALEDLVDVDSGAPSQIVDVRAVTHETAGLHIPLAPEQPAAGASAQARPGVRTASW